MKRLLLNTIPYMFGTYGVKVEHYLWTAKLLRKTNNELASLLIAILLETVLDAGLVSKWSINQSTVNAFFEWTSEKKWIRRESRVVDEVNNSKTPINILRAKG